MSRSGCTRRVPEPIGHRPEGRGVCVRRLRRGTACSPARRVPRRRAGAVLRLLAVHEPKLTFQKDQIPGTYDPVNLGRIERKRLARELDAAAAAIAPGIEVQHDVLEGSAVETLAAAAGNGVDLLTIGSRAYGPVRRVLLGGISSGLVRSSPAPALVVPRGSN